MTIQIDKPTVVALSNAMGTIVDWVNPASELAVVYYVMVNLPKALGLNDVKRKTSHS
jgi:hypothetical protein